MLISDKQHEANIRNAQLSTGPKTPEGKAKASLNALTYGLRASKTLLPDEDPEQYKQLWDELLAEWQPQTATERRYLEQMALAQWLLARMSNGQRRVTYAFCPDVDTFARGLGMIERITRLETKYERSFTTAMHELKQLQKDRREKTQPHPAEPKPKQPAKPNQHPEPPPPTDDPPQYEPAYVNSAAATDTR